VTNTGSVPINGWTVIFSWPGSQTVSQIWNATETQSGSTVTATNVSYNGPLAPGASTSFGLLGSGSAPPNLSNLRCIPHTNP